MLTRIVMIVMMTGTPATAIAAPHGGTHAARPLVEEFRTHPPQAAFPADSGDSLYRVARKAINDGDYRRAAALFQQLADRYPKSQYAGDALYWRAFALYRHGGADDLRASLASLELQRTRYPTAATQGDAAALATRVRGELARRGDPRAAEQVVRTADSAVRGCPSDDDDMRVAALNAMMQMDADQALPVLRKVLARRDACSETLRKKAVFLVAQKQGDESANILIDVARSDPSAEVRGDAVFWLGQVPGDRSVALLDSILQSTKDEDLQDKAIFALSQHEGPRSAAILRDLISQPNVAEDTKSRAIFALGHGRQSSETFAYLKQLFPTLASETLKDQVLMSVAQSGDDANRAWVRGVAQDPKQDIEVRKKALFWLGQSGGSLDEILALYDQLPDEALKEQVIFVLSQRREPAATDKLIDIAKHDGNRELRKKAIFWLGQRDDPRVRKLLEELIDNDVH